MINLGICMAAVLRFRIQIRSILKWISESGIRNANMRAKEELIEKIVFFKLSEVDILSVGLAAFPGS